MIDLERKVNFVTFLHHSVQDVVPVRTCDVEIARDTVKLHVPFESAALLGLELLSDTIFEHTPQGVLLCPRLDTDIVSISVKSVLMNLPIVIIDVVL